MKSLDREIYILLKPIIKNIVDKLDDYESQTGYMVTKKVMKEYASDYSDIKLIQKYIFDAASEYYF